MNPFISLEYVSSAHNFWLAMGLTISTGMVVGGLFYNGDFKRLTKGLSVLVSYLLLLLFVTLSRLHGIEHSVGFLDPTRAFAGVTTIAVTSFAYFLGMIIGVSYLKLLRRH